MQKIFWFYIFNFIAISLFSQDSENIVLKFQDQHNSAITQLLFHPGGEYFFTADETGKILMWNTSDYSFRKTIAESRNGRPIRKMKLRDNGATLMVAEGYQGKMFNYSDRSYGSFDPSYDSVAFYSLFTDKPPVKANVSFDIFPHSSDSIFLCAIYKAAESYIMAITDSSSSKELFHLGFQQTVTNAALSADRTTMAVVERERIDYGILKIIEVSSGKVTHSDTIIQDVLHLSFDEGSTSLHIIGKDQDLNSILISELSLTNFKLNKINEYDFPFIPENVQVIDEAQDKIIIGSNYRQPLILEKKDGHFQRSSIELPKEQINICGIVPGTDHLIYFKNTLVEGGYKVDFLVWYPESKTILKKYTKNGRVFQKAFFLPDDNWLVTGTSEPRANIFESRREFYKYYSNGTLNNRFSRLDFIDYLKVHHKIEPLDNFDHAIDEESGMMVFPAFVFNESGDPKYRYIIYDLLTDQIDTSITSEVDLPIPVSYRDNLRRLLITFRDDKRDFKIIEPGREYDFKGKYTHAELSLQGEHILLVDDEKNIKIYHISQNKLLFNQKIEGRDLSIGAIDSGFWYSYTYWNKEESLLMDHSVLLSPDGNAFVKNEYEKVKVLDIDFKNGVAAIIMKDLGVVLGEKNILFTGEEFPHSVSLNEDASRMILNFNNGLIKVYESSTLQLLGTMYHPNGREHVILNSNGYFTGNADLSSYLMVENSGQPVNPDQLFIDRNKPEEVLQIFGTADPYYYDLLKRTSEIRKNSISNNPDNYQVTSKPEILSVLINGQRSFTQSKEPNAQLDLKIIDTGNAVNKVMVWLNGVEVISKNISHIKKGKKENILVDVPLVNGENYITINVSNESGTLSDPVERFLLYNEEQKMPDLYLLTIGVSEYQQQKYNLTFADKDALDLSILYGDTSTIDVSRYEQRYFGYRYFINDPLNPRHSEIRHYSGLYTSHPDLVQVDHSGNYWLEEANESFYLWDFERSTRTEIEIPALKYYYSLVKNEFIPDPDNDQFYYKDDKKWYSYSFRQMKQMELDIPVDAEIFPLKGPELTLLKSAQEYKTSIIVEFYNLNNGKSKNIELEFNEEIYAPQLIAVSADGKRFLISDNDRIWMYNQDDKNPNLLQIQNLKHTYGDRTYFTNDGKMISLLNKDFDDTQAITVWRHYLYNIENGVLDSFINYDIDFGLIGINNINGTVKYIGFEEPIAKTPGFFNDFIKERTEIKPSSFDKVHILTLTNESATKDAILKNLNDFFRNAAIDDEVIIFLAGHGLLDSSLTYYYAPHDMDFKAPELKGISYYDLISSIKKIPAVRKLLLLDTCHSGEVSDDAKGKNSTDQEHIADKDQRGVVTLDMGEEEEHHERTSDILALLFENMNVSTGITVLAASSGSDVAYESKELSNGAFTTAYIKGIENKFKLMGDYFIQQDKVQPITLSDEFIYELQKSVISSTDNKQIPNVREINMLGDIKVW